MEGPRQPLAAFTLEVGGEHKPASEVLQEGTYGRDKIDDPEACAHFVPISWRQTVSVEDAVREAGFFGNQNTVAAPRTPAWRITVERLKEHFPQYDSPAIDPSSDSD